MLLFARGLSFITGNPIAQRLLEWSIVRAQYLMGIGSGGEVANSGEKIALTLAVAEHSGGSHGNPRATSLPICIFDIGANIGQFSGMAKTVLKGYPYTIHCFEPGSHTFDQLRKNIGDDDGFRLNNFALGENVGSASLFYDEAGSGLASMTKRNLDHFGIDFNRSEPISVDTVDNYCDRSQIDKIDLLKMDVEGHELDVLKGAARLLDDRRIDSILFEFGGCNVDTRSFLRDYYYFFKKYSPNRMFRITPSGYLSPLDSCSEVDEQFRTTNFLVKFS